MRNHDPASAAHGARPELHLFPGRSVVRIFPRDGDFIDIPLARRYALVLVILADQQRADDEGDRPNGGWMTRRAIVDAYIELTNTWSITEPTISHYLSAIKRAMPDGFALFERKRGSGARLLRIGITVIEWAARA